MTIDELITALEQATGNDRELDCEIAVLLKGGYTEWRQANWTMESYPIRRFQSSDHIGGWGSEPVARYTESVDAALGIVPEGWRCWMSWGCGIGDAGLMRPDTSDMGRGWTAKGCPERMSAPTTALAICVVAIKALAEAQQHAAAIDAA